MNRPYFLLFLLLCAAGISAVAIAKKHSAAIVGTGLQVTASFDTLGEFVRRVGGDAVTVSVVTPPGAEPHDFEPSPQDLLRAEHSAVFIMQGAGLDTWANTLRPTLDKHGVSVLNVTVSLAATHALLSPDGKILSSVASNATTDPHTWLDPKLAGTTVELIRDTLTARDPAHASVYGSNARTFLNELRTLDAAYTTRLASCTQRTFVTTHAAFQYLAHDYRLTMLPIAGVVPDEEPSPRHLAQLVTLVREKQIKYVFFETLVSPRIAQTLAQEAKATTLVLNPLEGLTKQERAAGKTYGSVMTENLNNLTLALGCP